MGQTKLESFIESVCNVGSGFIIAALTWHYIVTPIFGYENDTGRTLKVTLIFTVVSVIRGFIWRRIFNGRKK